MNLLGSHASFTAVLTAVAQWLRSLVRSQLVSLEFFIDIKSYRSHCSPGVDSASNRTEYQEHFLGVKAVGAKVDNLITILCRCHEIWVP